MSETEHIATHASCPSCGYAHPMAVPRPRVRFAMTSELVSCGVACPACGLSVCGLDEPSAWWKWDRRVDPVFLINVPGERIMGVIEQVVDRPILDLAKCPKCCTNESVEITRNRDGWTIIRCIPCGGVAGTTGVVERTRAEAIEAWEKLPRT